MTLIADFISTF